MPRAAASSVAPYLIAPEELSRLLPGQPDYRTHQLRDWLYRTPVLDSSAMTNLPGSVRDDLTDRLWPFEVETEAVADSGTTRKWLFRGFDRAAIETVLMGYPATKGSGRATVCVSSQVGCALGCSFCATGQFGFDRHLEPGEIVAQVAYAHAALRNDPMPGVPDHPTNVVFMGMGEPLVNYERVRESLRRLIEVGGMSARSVTVSTVGVVPGIRRLATEPWQINLAISLHAADDGLRSRLVPLNRRYPIAEVEAAAADFFAAKGRRVSLEWTMIDGVNDGQDQAALLARIARRLRAHVNLIAMNPTPLSSDRPSSRSKIEAFASRLRSEGVAVTVRETRGREIDGGCGQLRLRACGS